MIKTIRYAAVLALFAVPLCFKSIVLAQNAPTPTTSSSSLTPTATQTTPPAPFVSIAPDQTSEYKFDFGRDFYPTPAAYDAAVAQCKATLAKLVAYRGKVIASPENLLNTLKLNDQFNVQFTKAYEYSNLQYSVDTKNTAARDLSSKLNSDLSSQTAFVSTEISQISPETVKKFMAEEPALKPYAYAIYENVRSKPHTLSEKEETLLAALSPSMIDWQSDIYNLLMDRAPWGKVTDPDEGALDVRQDEEQINNSPTREVRKEGHDKTAEAYKSERDLFAFDVIRVAKTQNLIAKLHHFKNGQDAAFFNLYLSYGDIDNAFNAILSNGELRKKSQKILQDRIGTFTGYSPVEYYDMTVVPPGVAKPRFTIGEATKVIKESTWYLGPEWNKQLSDLLNPKNGRLDIVPGENRVPNAFAIPAPGFNSVFYSYGFQGFTDDVVTLAHESGHVVHDGLMNANRVLPVYEDGPRYFTESYAILDEYVLLDSLYRNEKDPGRKVYYLEELLRELMGLYSTTGVAAFEKAMYEGVDSGKIQNADDLDKLSYDIGSKWSIWFDEDPPYKDLWQVVPHYYSSPTYYVNYVFASLLAETYFSMYKKDPVAFGKKFTALERNGFNDKPDRLLKKFLGIDLKNPSTYTGVFAQQKAYLNDLQSLYAQVPVQKLMQP